jgi:hypothetical protein
MRRKHLSVTIICFALTVTGMVLWFEVRHLKTSEFVSSAGTIRPLSEIKVPSKSALEQMDRLERQMHLISAPPPQIRRRADLSAMGYVPVSPSRNGSDGVHNSKLAASAYRVTMAFDGQIKRYCIIDSKLYPEGAMLPDGNAIIKIESTRVLIAKENLQQWLTVDPLFGPAVSKES